MSSSVTLLFETSNAPPVPGLLGLHFSSVSSDGLNTSPPPTFFTVILKDVFDANASSCIPITATGPPCPSRLKLCIWQTFFSLVIEYGSGSIQTEGPATVL